VRRDGSPRRWRTMTGPLLSTSRFLRSISTGGRCGGGLGRIDLALQDFTAAIALDPSITTAYSNRALAFIALGRYTEAMTDLDRAIALDPSSWMAYVYRGRAHLTKGDRERAAADFRTACAAGERGSCLELQRMVR